MPTKQLEHTNDHQMYVCANTIDIIGLSPYKKKV